MGNKNSKKKALKELSHKGCLVLRTVISVTLIIYFLEINMLKACTEYNEQGKKPYNIVFVWLHCCFF